MWFRKNENVKIGDINYNSYGGEGWEHLTNMLNTTIYDRSPVLTLYSEDNKVYRNKYKIVAVYEDSFPVEQEFIIYNKKHNHNVELSSDSGLYFKSSDTVIEKTITCKIDENVVPPSEDYNFEWYIDNTKVRTKEELKAWEIDINQRIQNGENVTTEELNEYKFISNVEIIEPNIITVSSTILDDIHKQVTVVCKIFILDNIFDIVEIVLKNQLSGQISVRDYYIEIENGNQVFQYNEAGISPTSARYEDPQKTLQLSCKLYDPAGGYIDRLSYTEIAWIVPIENTLIQVDNNLLQDNSNGLKNRIIGDICNFSIAEEYNYSFTNNQIICEIKYNEVTYRQSTDFFFGKVGDDGTNGTDVVVKISPITLSDILTEELLTLEIDETDEANITQE